MNFLGPENPTTNEIPQIAEEEKGIAISKGTITIDGKNYPTEG